MIGAGGVMQQGLGHGRPAPRLAGGEQAADLLRAGGAAGLARLDDLEPPGAQGGREPAGLGRFAGPLAAFEGDESAALSQNAVSAPKQIYGRGPHAAKGAQPLDGRGGNQRHVHRRHARRLDMELAHLLPGGDRGRQRTVEDRRRLDLAARIPRQGHHEIGLGPERHGLLGAEPDRCRDQRRVGLGELVIVEIAKGPLVELQRLVGARLLRIQPLHHHDDPPAVLHPGGDEAVAGTLGMAGLDAVGAHMLVEQRIAVALLDAVIGEVELGEIMIILGIVGDQMAGQHLEVAGGGVMVRVGPAVRIHEMRARHAELLRLGVHALGETLLAPGHALGDDDAGIIARLHDDAAQQILDLDVVAELDIHLRALHAPGALGDGEAVGQLELAALQRLEEQIGRHHLGQGGRLDLSLAVLVHQHGAGVVVGDVERLRRGLDIRGPGREKRRRDDGPGEGDDERQAERMMFHASSHDSNPASKPRAGRHPAPGITRR